jgi:DnaJ-class molecular chaperone
MTEISVRQTCPSCSGTGERLGYTNKLCPGCNGGGVMTRYISLSDLIFLVAEELMKSKT